MGNPMATVKRRAVALTIGLATVLVAGLWTMIGGEILHRYASANLSQNVPLSQAAGPRPDAWDQGAHLYYIASSVSLLLAAGASASLLVLMPGSDFRKRAWIYCAFLAIVLPAIWYNYGQRDIVLRGSLQVALNGVLIFLASTTALWLSNATWDAPDARVLKYLSLTLLLLGGVFVPSIFSAVWLFHAAGLLTIEQSREITFQHITGLASVLSAVTAWLNYTRDRRKAEVHESTIVIKR
jgi:hypothetical protein